MYLNILLSALIVLLWFGSSEGGILNYNKQSRYVLLIGVVFVLLAALRAETVGPDTPAYVNDYAQIKYCSLIDVVSLYHKGTGYYFFSKLFSMTGLPLQVWFGVVEAFYFYANAAFFKKFSDNPLFSILLFLTLGLYSFSLAGLKQTLAMAFALLSFIQFYDKKYIIAAILFILAYWSHSVAVISLIPFAIYLFRNNRILPFAVLAFALAAFFLGDWLWTFMIGNYENEDYANYIHSDNIYTISAFIFYLTLLVLSFIIWRRSQVAEYNKFFLYVSVFVLAFQSFATSFSIAFRMAYFFSPFLCVLIPNCCYNDGEIKRNQIFQIIIVAIVIFWFVYTGRGSEYSFFFMS